MIEPRTPPVSDRPPRLGQPIALEDVLALAPDGRRYTRDEQGRLATMAPEDAGRHGAPRDALRDLLAPQLDRRRWRVRHEPGVAFDPILALGGRPIPPSRLGRRTLEPDLAVFGGRPRLVERTPGGAQVFAPEGLALIVELLSPATWPSDLGLGAGEAVDRWRTYLGAGVPEYWLLNAWQETVGLPPRSALFLRREGAAWRALEVEGAVPANEGPRPHGFEALRAGVVRSQVLPGLVFDLEAFWRELDLELGDAPR